MEIKTLTFFSNYYNHHQKALCDEWYSILGDGFTFVETEPIEGFRATMGWGKEEVPPYVLRTYLNKENRNRAFKLALESDLVIMGTAPEEFIEERIKQNKIIFRYSERPLKEGFIKFFIPRLTKKYLHLHVRNRRKKIYVLAASAYTAWDFRKMFNSYPGKCYKFGYFPEHREYDVKKLMDMKEITADRETGDPDMPTILWEGRMLRLKRPDLLIKAAAILREKGYDFRLTFIGEGKERKKIQVLAKMHGLSDITKFMDFLSPPEARDKMADAKIYVMTSNFLEGWGSVIYEALNAGCAVVASHAPGATPWLVKNGKTGLVFRSGDVFSLADQLEKLLRNPDLCVKYGTAAYEQMSRLWNPKVAAANVLTLADDLSEGRRSSIKEGPCSVARILRNDWY
ncbi:MAG: glycosyltransferase family 4 protein [Lachnospiraceae bacterium]|nr:glycosyltransferase family 4 protein [Lachnospiraceae bacterium]